MTSKQPNPPLDPMDFFPFRGQYGGDSIGTVFFVMVRLAVPVISYSLLAPPTTALSAFRRFPFLLPSTAAPSGSFDLPFVPNTLLSFLHQAFGLQPYPVIIFLGATLPTFSFIAYSSLWRRERFPMTGQGGSLQVTTQVNLVDIMHSILFVYLVSNNPTWSASLFRWMPVPFVFGLILHVWSDHSKYLFRKDSRNKGKVYTSGPWGVIRHPNFLGFSIWRTGFATAAGGWAFGGSMLLGFIYLFYVTSIPILERYMKGKYGKQWEVVTQKVRWKFLPGIW
ncbi:hypothetical protein ONS95_011826 [Cadophora gregata]|uniref:uncharacterized protein n=1 Tax=Cadophora gregata TaxID=51156 RepID=UPI0026DACAED|nr:uncharacterized protein ONS95_011826 [Cadophora gregata]KAK0117486.1 hypothetical protein ONS95_011826 [Cadophora gregata]KAK0122541.1 hypothetical protein ONS96_009583 [Cadophora gregata f. sp. sojae]